MKKALLTLALAAFAFAANAQFVVGGHIGYSNNGGNNNTVNIIGATTTEWDVPANVWSTFTIMPKIGYNLNDKMQVGAAFGVTSTYNRVYNAIYGAAYTPLTPDAEDWQATADMGFTFAPYFRYNLLSFNDKLTFFCEAQLGLTFNGKTKYSDHATAVGVMPAIDTTYKGNTKSNIVEFTITPGLNYKINNKLSADLYIDLLGIGYTHRTVNTFVDLSAAGVTNTTETTRTSDDFRFIANANAQTLGAHLANFRLGFNYHF
ncbi:MAG: hypothetical protein IKR33_01845 [Bacteroidales bacterium]|nr:hypothetical protein [Bacteroidales bacterium]